MKKILKLYLQNLNILQKLLTQLLKKLALLYDPIVTGDSNEKAYNDYIIKMQENLNTLKEALK